MTLTFPVAPMKATMGSLPSPDVDDAWAYEVKWDGYRTIAHIDDGAVRLQSTAGLDVTHRWPELTDLADAVNATSAILDGELVAFGDDGRPSFSALQASGDGRTPCVLHLFDVLSVNGVATIDAPYRDRRRLLADLVEDGERWRVPAHRVGDGAALVEATRTEGLEGVIAKRLDSPYDVGARSRHWRKIKHRIRVEVPIGGFTTGSGNRAGSFGALLVGHPDPSSTGALTFAGGVGTGFTQATLDELGRTLGAIETDQCPFDPPPPAAVRRTARWVQPTLTARIEIAEFTNDGHVRHASFVELVET